MHTTITDTSSPRPAHVPKASSNRSARWFAILVIAAGFAFGLANGVVQGRTWAEAAETLANWSHSYGSLDWMDQIAAVIVLCLGSGFIALIGGVLVALLSYAHRGAVLWVMIAAVIIGSFVGFVVMTGIGGGSGFEPGELAALVFLVSFCAVLGAWSGYGIGRVGAD